MKASFISITTVDMDTRSYCQTKVTINTDDIVYIYPTKIKIKQENNTEIDADGSYIKMIDGTVFFATDEHTALVSKIKRLQS